jgi:hypothetical protein
MNPVMAARRASTLRNGLSVLLAALLFSAQLLMVLHEGTHDLLNPDADHCGVCFLGAALHQAATAAPPVVPPPPAVALATVPAPADRPAHVRVDPHPKRGPPRLLDA